MDLLAVYVQRKLIVMAVDQTVVRIMIFVRIKSVRLQKD